MCLEASKLFLFITSKVYCTMHLVMSSVFPCLPLCHPSLNPS